MENIYNRICENKPFDEKLKPYSKKDLKKLLFYLEQKEEYEKCQIVNNFIKERFNHKYNFILKREF
jgi:hypothetical protein